MITNPGFVADYVGEGYVLFVSPVNEIKLLWPPDWPLGHGASKEVKVGCSLDEIFAAMSKRNGGPKDLPEHDKHLGTARKLLGWRDSGFTEEGRYIKYVM